MAEKIYSVFVSSTFDDLREERAEVQRSLLRAKCFPIGMELFPSTDEETWEFIKHQIEDADFYLVIVGGRYGSLARDGVSYTEKEYNFAREIKKPTLAFVHHDPNQIQSGKTDQDDERRRKLQNFLAKIQERPLVSRYSNPHELGLQVLASIMHLRENNADAVGFVRANEVADFKRYADALEEISRLKSLIENMEIKSVPFPEADFPLNLSIKIHKNREFQEERLVNTSWKLVFLSVAAEIILNPGATTSDVRNAIAKAALENKEEGLQFYFSDDGTFNIIKSTLFARDLVEFEAERREREVFGHTQMISVHLWHLTENGKVLYRSLMYGN